MEQNSDGIEIGRNKVGLFTWSTHSLMIGLMNYVAKDSYSWHGKSTIDVVK